MHGIRSLDVDKAFTNSGKYCRRFPINTHHCPHTTKLLNTFNILLVSQSAYNIQPTFIRLLTGSESTNMVHTMENTSMEQLRQLDLMQRWVAVNHLICDLLWDFTGSNIAMCDMSAEEFHACASVMGSVDPKILRLLPYITLPERRSLLNDQLDKYDNNTLQVLGDMVLERLPTTFGVPIAWSKTPVNGDEIPGARPPANNNLATTPLPFRKYRTGTAPFIYSPPSYFAETRAKAISSRVKKAPPPPVDVQLAQQM